MKFNLTESEHLQIEIFLNFDWLVRVSQHWAKRPQGKDEGGGEKNEKRHTRKRWKKHQNSRFVEINPSGFPKMRGKNKFEKGGTGMENGWGSKMAHTQAHEKNQIFFSKFFLWRISLSALF